MKTKSFSCFLAVLVKGLHVCCIASNEPKSIKDGSSEMLQLLQKIKTERNFDIVVVVSDGRDFNADCKLILEYLTVSKLVINAAFIDQFSNYGLSHEALIVMCYTKKPIGLEFIVKQQFFHDSFSERFLVVTPEISKDEVDLQCKEFMSKNIYNVLLTTSGSFRAYYNCVKAKSIDGNFYIKKHLFHVNKLYSNQFQDMHGDEIIVQPDLYMPRSGAYYDKWGNVVLTGLVPRLIQTFSQKHNATLKLAWPIEDVNGVEKLETLLQAIDDEKLDMILGGFAVLNSTVSFSYPFYITQYCLMIPMPDIMGLNTVFLHMLSVNIIVFYVLFIFIYGALLIYSETQRLQSVLDFKCLVNDKALRGILGQSFPLHTKSSVNTKFIAAQLCFISLITNTTYLAFLQSFFTQPPHEAMITNYEGIRRNNLKILVCNWEMDYLLSIPNLPVREYTNIFQLVDNYAEIMKRRESLDVKFVYPTTTFFWSMFELQQKFFERPVFHFSQELCLNKFVLFSVPVRANLPYLESLDLFILRVQQHGLMNFWNAMSFYDMIRMGRMRMKHKIDLGVFHHGALALKDLTWIWYFYIVCNLIAFFAFIGEQVFYHYSANKSINN